MARLAEEDAATHAHLKEKLLALNTENPYAAGTMEKIGENKFRVRQGDWRALLLVRDEERSILIEAVPNRRDAY